MPTLRFAPSPNGLLHLGHAYSALLNQHLARALGGRLLLRVEDIDPARSSAAFEAAILRDLAWLGIGWEGPERRQSAHLAVHTAALARLEAAGFVYPCFCTRGTVRAAVADAEAVSGRAWPRDPDGAPLYPGTCRQRGPAERARRIGAGEPWALRLDMAAVLTALGAAPGWREFGGGLPDVHADRPAGRIEAGFAGPGEAVAADPAAWGDVVLARRDVPTSYHLGVVVDDAAQGVTHVVRGRDLRAATSVHRVLQALLDLPAPLYLHHRLVLDAAGGKLSKSLGATALAALRDGGTSAAAVRHHLGFG
jgi:glutamyl-Q tRNA(Asp) synthetase